MAGIYGWYPPVVISTAHEKVVLHFFFVFCDRPAVSNPTTDKCVECLQTVLSFLFRGLLGARLFSDGDVELFFGNTN